ncbi:hypothetical protein [Bdellovibrio sp. ZAP7]|uniref:hypothetical protein n=1 Tax=Bdellovibrio sp. ZAP7 TaxID=2231053 RepID=UPI001AEFDEAA|nr:hypothetical protein [Bdellovibrio sp. ZAP7]
MSKWHVRVWIYFLCVFCARGTAQAAFQLRDVDVQKMANSVVALMSYSAIPDLASSSLSINNAQTGNPSIAMTQFGGGFTISKSTPLYLEGAAAYSRYDPKFIASDGAQERSVPLKWNSGTVQGGAGWDFEIYRRWVIRPIFNFSFSMLFSDTEIGAALIADYKDLENIDFLDNGNVSIGGLGGALMLAYEFHDDVIGTDVDLQLRYSYIHLQSMGGSRSISGYSDSSTANLYYRFRAPMGDLRALGEPFRYVLEGSASQYFGDQVGVLGFHYLATAGLGIELDSSDYNVWVTRTRLVGRYMFGDNVSGYSVGLACSF